MRPLGWVPTEPGTRRTALKVAEATNHPLFDVIVMRSWGDWTHGGPEPETSGPQNLQVIGALDAFLQSTLSSKTEPVHL